MASDRKHNFLSEATQLKINERCSRRFGIWL